jgi:hypothetical protein
MMHGVRHIKLAQNLHLFAHNKNKNKCCVGGKSNPHNLIKNLVSQYHTKTKIVTPAVSCNVSPCAHSSNNSTSQVT